MHLLGIPLVVLLASLAVLLPVLTVGLWSRLPAPDPARRAARLGLVVASQLAAVLLVAACVNDYGYFYDSWTSLWGGVHQAVLGTSAHRAPVRAGSRAQDVPAGRGGIRVVSSDPGFSTRATWAARGRLESVRVDGPITGLHEPAHVYLPPQYFWRRDAHTRFPAAEILTGYPGGPNQLVKTMGYPRKLLGDLRHRQARPMVLVLMRSTPVFPRDAECTDVPGGPQVETYLAQDVPWDVSRRYRVAPDAWGAVGASTGGYCAAKIAMRHASVFHAAVSLSGYFTAVQDKTTGSLWAGSRLVRDLNDLDWRLRHLPAPPVSILVATSRDEGGPLGIANSRRFIALARPPMRVSWVVSAHGGHTFTTWLPLIPRSLDWLSTRLTGLPR